MKWRFGTPDGHGGGRYLWATVGRWRLYRIMPDPAGWWVPGLFRLKPIMTVPHLIERKVRRTYRTVYGARMAAEAAERSRR